MNVENIKVKKDIPISATKIRKEPEKNKKFMEKNVYQEFKKYNKN